MRRNRQIWKRKRRRTRRKEEERKGRIARKRKVFCRFKLFTSPPRGARRGGIGSREDLR